VTLLVQNATSGTATQSTVDGWIAKYSLNHDVVADPGMSLAAGGTIGLPYNVIVDPRTMKIVKIIPGDGPTVEATIDSLIKTNGG
jgi:hypothetical protein